MKQTTLIAAFLMMLLFGKIGAQKSTIDTVLWDNGKYTLVSELKKVWIHQTNGLKHKRVDIHTIDTLSGKIEYYFEGTFHDVRISSIDRITPAKFYDHAIFFMNNKVPLVQQVVLDGDPYNDATFISHLRPKPALVKDIIVTEPVVSTPTVQTKEEATNKPVAYDEIIFSDGKTLKIKIISFKEGNVHYKRSDILSGPVYIVSLTIPGTLKLAQVTVHDDHKIIDYRLK